MRTRSRPRCAGRPSTPARARLGRSLCPCKAAAVGRLTMRPLRRRQRVPSRARLHTHVITRSRPRWLLTRHRRTRLLGHMRLGRRRRTAAVSSTPTRTQRRPTTAWPSTGLRRRAHPNSVRATSRSGPVMLSRFRSSSPTTFRPGHPRLGPRRSEPTVVVLLALRSRPSSRRRRVSDRPRAGRPTTTHPTGPRHSLRRRPRQRRL
jgi:hypothetical protein